ncbi:MAG: NAD(P)-dependent glycerol-3-phosphate dehydrogenase [Candidatus Omnitrophica bacterium]|nr:NAD(P)-dependent glycerol-3-phosphate dehydrogenase [Candidatus Omnitrophota bacterium]
MHINKKFKIGILGDGGWGTTIAILLSGKGYPVILWSAFPDNARRIIKDCENKKFLPDIKIPEEVKITYDLSEASLDKDLIILAAPSQYIRLVLKKLKQSFYERQAIYLSVAKGIEVNTLKRVSEVVREELGNVKLAVLSGPTIACEVAKGIPTVAVVASRDLKTRKAVQDVFMTDRFRIYTNSDLLGVELGGSLKNVIAIACGACDGLGFGTNTKAAILARGLAEISRLGKAMGASSKTFSGISGLGDLVTTCISPYSRNRFVGEELGKGKSLKQIKADMNAPSCRKSGIAEGIPTAKSAYSLSLKYKVDMPIVKEVYNVIYRNKPALKAVRDLMAREKKEE